jgi:hypothetical protein
MPTYHPPNSLLTRQNDAPYDGELGRENEVLGVIEADEALHTIETVGEMDNEMLCKMENEGLRVIEMVGKMENETLREMENEMEIKIMVATLHSIFLVLDYNIRKINLPFGGSAGAPPSFGRGALTGTVA